MASRACLAARGLRLSVWVALERAPALGQCAGSCSHQIRTHSARAFAQQAAHLQPMELPQTTDPLLVDVLGPIDQDADPAIAVAWVLHGQGLNLAQQRRIVSRVRDVTEGRAMDLHQGTGSLHRQSTGHEELHRRALLGHRQPFFPNSSLSRSFSSSRSASSRLRRAFSFSSSFRRWASLTDIPP